MKSLMLSAFITASAGMSAQAASKIDQTMICKVDVTPGQTSPFILQFVIKGSTVVAALQSVDGTFIIQTPVTVEPTTNNGKCPFSLSYSFELQSGSMDLGTLQHSGGCAHNYEVAFNQAGKLSDQIFFLDCEAVPSVSQNILSEEILPQPLSASNIHEQHVPCHTRTCGCDPRQPPYYCQ